MVHNEAHLVDINSGHELSRDCWCEPSWEKVLNPFGIEILVVKHTDYVPYHHKHVLMCREMQPTWVDQILDSIGEKND